MRKQVYGAVIAAAMMISVGVFAQDQQSAPADQQHKQGTHGQHGKGHMDPQAQLDHLSKELNLTDDQKARIKPILENSQQQMLALKNDTTSDQQTRRTKAMEIHKSTMDQVRPILTADQQQKFDQIQQQRKQQGHMHGGKHGGQQAPPSTPQS